MPLDLTDDKSTLVQVMAWCRQATSHYLSQCWPKSLSLYGNTRPQWVNGARLWADKSWLQCYTHFQQFCFCYKGDLIGHFQWLQCCSDFKSQVFDVWCHYDDVIMGTMASQFTTMVSQITSLTIVYSTVYSGTDQRKHQTSASLAFVRGIHRGPVNFPHKWPLTRRCFHLMTSSWSFEMAYEVSPYDHELHVFICLTILRQYKQRSIILCYRNSPISQRFFL